MTSAPNMACPACGLTNSRAQARCLRCRADLHARSPIVGVCPKCRWPLRSTQLQCFNCGISLDAESKPAADLRASRRQAKTGPAPGIRERIAAGLWWVTSRPRVQLLLGAVASLGGGYETRANLLGLKQALRRSSPADSALSAALLALWLLITLGGLLILCAGLLRSTEESSP